MTVFTTLLVMLAASMTMFLLLVRRWTAQRRWVTLREWARARRFRVGSREQSNWPDALRAMPGVRMQMRLHLQSQGIAIVQIQTDAPAGSMQAPSWNLLICCRKRRQSATAGLRPAAAPASFLDLLGLSQFPTLSLGYRFVVLAASSASARGLAESASRTVLPPDIGLLLFQEWLILDFSTRPFDPTELDRMIALSQQLNEMI
jgi:hypothetical protein